MLAVFCISVLVHYSWYKCWWWRLGTKLHLWNFTISTWSLFFRNWFPTFESLLWQFCIWQDFVVFWGDRWLGFSPIWIVTSCLLRNLFRIHQTTAGPSNNNYSPKCWCKATKHQTVMWISPMLWTVIIYCDPHTSHTFWRGHYYYEENFKKHWKNDKFCYMSLFTARCSIPHPTQRFPSHPCTHLKLTVLHPSQTGLLWVIVGLLL